MAAKKHSTTAVPSSVPPDRLDVSPNALAQLEQLGIAIERLARKLGHDADLEPEVVALIALGARVEALSNAAWVAVHDLEEPIEDSRTVVEGLDDDIESQYRLVERGAATARAPSARKQ